MHDACRLRNVKVRNSQSVDLSSVKAMIRDITTPRMNARERALAVFRFLHHHTYHGLYPKPFALRDKEHPVGHLNMAPWGECGWAATLLAHFLEVAGIRRRLIDLGKEGVWNSHRVVEAWFDDGWRYLDTGAGTCFCKRDGRTIAAVAELIADNSLITNPSSREGFLFDPDGAWLQSFARGSFFDSWRVVDEADDGSRPRPSEILAIDLVRGDELTLSCEKDGDMGFWFYPAGIPPEEKKYAEWRNGCSLPGAGPRPISDPVNRRWNLPGFSNSRLVYTADFDGGAYRDRMVESFGLGGDEVPFLHPERLNSPAHAVFEITSPFIMVKGWMESAVAVLGQKADRLAISISTDPPDTSRRHWETLVRFDYDVRRLNLLDITPHIYGKYAYWIRFDLYASDKTVHDVRVESLKLVSVFQTSPKAVPRLGPGENRIAVTLDNPEALERLGLTVEYCWKERRSADRVEERTDRRAMTVAGLNYVLSTGEADPVTRYVRMSVGDQTAV